MVKPGPCSLDGGGGLSSRLSPRVIKSHPEADTKGIVLSWSQPQPPAENNWGGKPRPFVQHRVRSDGGWENAEYFSAKISHLLNLYIKGTLKPPLF